MPAWLQGFFTVTLASKHSFLCFFLCCYWLLCYYLIILHFEINNFEGFTILLQPLMDNLEAQTYETFERDAMKYIQVWQCMHAILNLMYPFYEYISFMKPL